MFFSNWQKCARGEKRFSRSTAFFLKKAESLYGKISQRVLEKREREKESYPIPFCSIGNLTVGGTGKTAAVIAICAHLSEKRRVVVLHNAYGARKKGKSFLVASGGHLFLTPEEAGDEAILLAKLLPKTTVLAHPNRKLLATYACKYIEPDVLVLDDGFQQRSLFPKIDILVVDALSPFGNGHLFPYGTLREPLSALSRADALLISRSDAVPPDDLLQLKKDLQSWTAAPQFLARFLPQSVAPLKAPHEQFPLSTLPKKIGLFAAIGSPEAFLKTVRSLDISPRCALFFPDHILYTPKRQEQLQCALKKHQLDAYLTTEKDAVKLTEPIPFPVWILKGRMDIEAQLFQWLEERLP